MSKHKVNAKWQHYWCLTLFLVYMLWVFFSLICNDFWQICFNCFGWYSMFFLVDMQCFFLLLVLPEGCRDCYDSLSIDFFSVVDIQKFMYLMFNGFCGWCATVFSCIWCSRFLVLMCNVLYLMCNGFCGWFVMVLYLMFNGFGGWCAMVLGVDVQWFCCWCVMVLYLMLNGFGGWCAMVLLLMCNDFVDDVQCFCCWCAMFCLFVDLSFPWSRRRLLTVIWSWQSGMTPVFSPLMSKWWGLWPSTSPRWTYPKLPLIGRS